MICTHACRVVHAAAAGAYGEFEVTHDVSDITSADFLNGIGKKTRVLARISTVGPEKGGADAVRDVRGFAVKFYTKEGNNDWVFNDIVSSRPEERTQQTDWPARLLRPRPDQVPVNEPLPQAAPADQLP